MQFYLGCPLEITKSFKTFFGALIILVEKIMIKLNHSTLIFISGIIWLVIGCFLFSLGINFIVDALDQEGAVPVLEKLSLKMKLETTIVAILWIVFAVLVGWIKGYYILSRSVKKGVDHILALPNPAPLIHIYKKGTYLLIGGMMLLGYILRFASWDIRGGTDVAVGFALIQGAILYFRQAFITKQQFRLN